MKKVIAFLLCIMLMAPQAAFADTLPDGVIPIEDTAGGASSESTVPASASRLASRIGKDAKVSAGSYYLYPQLSSNRVVTIKDGSKRSGGNAYLYKYSGKPKQAFYIEAAGNGTYTIKNQRSGLVLEAAGGKSANGTNVQQGTYTGSAYQRWYIFKKGSYYVFQNAASRKVLHVSGSKNVSKANICLYKYTATTAQKFTLKKTSGSVSGTSSSKYRKSTRKWSDSRDYDILTNIIGAVESGGQVYGNRDYSAYDPPYTNSANEHTITLGWAQFYGIEGENLVKNIYKKDPAAFKKIDKKGKIQKALKKDWVATRWRPTNNEKNLLIKLISTDVGKKCQDELFKSYMVTFVADCKRLYTDNAWAVHMYCQIRHLGGPNGAKRIFDRCGGDYSLDSIMNALKRDQADGSSSYQVGDQIFWSRHVKCCEFLQKYAA